MQRVNHVTTVAARTMLSKGSAKGMIPVPAGLQRVRHRPGSCRRKAVRLGTYPLAEIGLNNSAACGPARQQHQHLHVLSPSTKEVCAASQITHDEAPAVIGTHSPALLTLAHIHLRY